MCRKKNVKLKKEKKMDADADIYETDSFSFFSF